MAQWLSLSGVLAIPLWQKAQEHIESILKKEDVEAIFQISEKLQKLNEQ